jgi:hypothetical protein
MLANLFGTTSGNPSTSVANFIPIHSVADTPTATETARLQVVPAAFTLQNFFVSVTTAPGAAASGKQYVYTVRKNQVDTAITVTLFETATTGLYSGAGVSFAAGDTISIGITPTNTPTVPALINWNIQANSGGTHFSPLLGGAHVSTGLSTSITSFNQLIGSNAGATWNATETNVQMIVPCGGTIDKLYVVADAVAGTGKTWALSLVKNGVATALTASITGNTVKTGNDTVNSFSVVAGDTLSIQAVPTSTPTVSRICWGVKFTPTNPGETFFGFGNPTAASTTATQYEFPLGAGNGAYSGTESTRQVMPGQSTLTAFYLLLGTAPGGATTRTLTLRRGAVATPLTVQLTSTATTGNITGQSVGLSQTDLVSLQSAETGTPAADTGGVHIGVLQYISVAAANTTNFLGFM